MAASLSPEQALAVLREIVVALVRRDEPQLSSHQLAVYLTCYIKQGNHTVRGLAADLKVSKSVITRALDRLGQLDLARRLPDPRDGRSIVVELTDTGRMLMHELQSLASAVATAVALDHAPLDSRSA